MLRPDEIAVLAAEALTLGKEIGLALSPDSDGGKKLTRAERHAIGMKALELAKHLFRDALD